MHNAYREAISEQITRMNVFVEEYNFERPHESLNQQVPGSCYEPSRIKWFIFFRKGLIPPSGEIQLARGSISRNMGSKNLQSRDWGHILQAA